MSLTLLAVAAEQETLPFRREGCMTAPEPTSTLEAPSRSAAASAIFDALRLIEGRSAIVDAPAKPCAARCDGKGGIRCFKLGELTSSDVVSIDVRSRVFLAYCPDPPPGQLSPDVEPIAVALGYDVVPVSDQPSSAAAWQPSESLDFRPVRDGDSVALPINVKKEEGTYWLRLMPMAGSSPTPNKCRVFQLRRETYGWKPPAVELTTVVWGRTQIPRAKDQFLRVGVNVFLVDKARRWWEKGFERVGFGIALPDVNPDVGQELSLGVVGCPFTRFLCGGVGWNVNGKIRDSRWYYVTLSGVDLAKAIPDAFSSRKDD